MSLPIAEKVVDFIFKNTPPAEKIRIGYFGGEPLLAFELIEDITDIIENHTSFDRERVELDVVSNGTIFSDEIAEFLNKHNIGLGISCDGPSYVQDMFRNFPDGKGSSNLVENTVKQANEIIPCLQVNAVYHPQTFQYLPLVVDYFSSLGLTHIYLNPDFSANWSKSEADLLPSIFNQIANRYINYYRRGNPHFISLIDSKIIVILRGGYQPLERCRMGKGEFAFTPSGNIYPCERLIGSDNGNGHCIGNIDEGLDINRMACKIIPNKEINTECLSCSLKAYCMNWCGCSNYFSSGYYNRVGSFLCASERAAIETAFDVFQILEKELGPTFIDHVTGMPVINGEGKEVQETWNVLRPHEKSFNVK